jgi:heparin binding hemagglutinin HbhA
MARNQTRNQNFTPVYAVIGVGDLAVEKLRDLSSDVQARSQKISLDPKQLQVELENVAKHRAEDARERADKAQQRAEDVLNEVVAQATTTYDSLAGRGKNLVQRIRRQQSTQAAKQSASTAKSQAKGATTTAKKGASSTSSTAKRSASNTASTAKQGASRTSSSAKRNTSATQSRAKGATTSARKSAESAGTATAQAAQKVGD